MSQIKTKFIENSAVTTAKIANNAVDATKLAANAVTGTALRLDNDQALKARNAANSADVNALKVNASDLLELLTNVELADRKVLNALVNFSTQASDPGSPATGDVYYNTVSNKLRQDNGTTWEDVSSVTGANQALSNLASVAINEDLVFNKIAPSMRSKDEPTLATQSLTIKTGDAAADASGDLTISTGTAGTTRGEMTLSARNVTVTGSNDIALNADQTATLGTLSATGQINVVTSQTIIADDNSATVSIRSGDTTGTGESGNVNIGTGNGEDGSETGRVNITTGDLNVTGDETGQITLRTGNANGTTGESGPVLIVTGDSVADNTGGINLTTGTAVNADSRGPVSINGRRIQLDGGPLFITNYASDPTVLTTYFAGDFYYNTTSNKLRFYDGAVWADVNAPTTLPVNEKTLITLSAGDITNQYVDLSHVARTNSIDFLVRGGGIMVEGASYDYSVSYTGGAGGNTRITFLNDLATGGPSALIAGDIVVIKYERIP